MCPGRTRPSFALISPRSHTGSESRDTGNSSAPSGASEGAIIKPCLCEAPFLIPRVFYLEELFLLLIKHFRDSSNSINL